MATKKKAVAKAPAPKKTRSALPAKLQRANARAKAATASSQDSAATQKPDKPRKPKLVRDRFTIPKSEYAVLDDLKQRAARLGRPAKKSEVLRAGVQALAAMGDAAFLAAVGAVPATKAGRSAKA